MTTLRMNELNYTILTIYKLNEWIKLVHKRNESSVIVHICLFPVHLPAWSACSLPPHESTNK